MQLVICHTLEQQPLPTPPHTSVKLTASFYERETAAGRGMDDLIRDLNWVIFSQRLTSCQALSKSLARCVLPTLRGDHLPPRINAAMLV